MSVTRIYNCLDSHVHWLATGRKAAYLDLSKLQSASDGSSLQVKPCHFCGDWLMGMGWDQNLWPGQGFPHHSDLDLIFDSTPVCFIRSDGHAAWVNQVALDRIADHYREPAVSRGEYWQQASAPRGGVLIRDEQGFPSGVFLDTAKEYWVDSLLPEIAREDVRYGLLQGTRMFNQAGFTHIRDMTCNPLQWEIATALDRTGELTLNVLEYFDAEDPEDFEEVLQQAIEARSTQTAHVRLGGVKVYLDGALGSEGAYISQHYQNGKGGRGFTLMDETRLKEIMAIAFMENMPLALHVIGDEAGHRAILTYLEIEKELGLHGELHLEHAQMLRPESISLMKEKNIICHLQPCHWLSDKRWLKEKLGLLFSTIFPWALLEHAGVKFDFGSDSPIEIPSLGNNQKAVNELMLEGIPKPEKAFSLYHQQRVDTNNTLSTYTDWGEDGSISVCFEGKLLSL